MLFFLVERAPVQRAEVLQTFWPDKPQARASANLRQIAYRVRRATGHDWWETDEEAIRLKPGLSLDYDVRRFERQARAALGLLYGDLRRVGALASTIALYTGDYLADLTVEWARDRRRELSELHINARLAYADELLGLLRYAEARDTLLPAIEADHYRSDLCERMLNALAGLGRRHEVSDHYRRYCDLLQRDLGLDPPPELRALYARLIQ
jgi:DNA-binding SARP family transcriptional activator